MYLFVQIPSIGNNCSSNHSTCSLIKKYQVNILQNSIHMFCHNWANYQHNAVPLEIQCIQLDALGGKCKIGLLFPRDVEQYRQAGLNQ